jgi:hypothetical protein
MTSDLGLSFVPHTLPSSETMMARWACQSSTLPFSSLHPTDRPDYQREIPSPPHYHLSSLFRSFHLSLSDAPLKQFRLTSNSASTDSSAQSIQSIAIRFSCVSLMNVWKDPILGVTRRQLAVSSKHSPRPSVSPVRSCERHNLELDKANVTSPR